MPPAGGPKRKRSDKTFSGDDNPRASPHRPQDLDLARQTQSQSPSQTRDDGRVTRRQSRGSRNATHQAQDAKAASPVADAAMANTPSNATAQVTMTNGQVPQTGKSSQPKSTQHRTLPYERLTDDAVQEWVGWGREGIKAQLIELCQDDAEITFEVVVEELLESAIAGRLDAHDAGLLVKEVIASTQTQDDAETGSPMQDAVLGAVLIIFAEESPSPHVAELAIFLAATEISTDVLREVLEAKLLEQLGLIRDTFHRQMIKKQTNALYRQANYNLLREESEGFSKLVTELFTTSGNEAPHGDVVDATVEKVKAMIGAFDLDVGRSLDVVLDVFGSVLVKQYRFFVKFLRASPWWPQAEGGAQRSGQFNVTGGLPLWALPFSKDWQLSDEQRHEQAREAAQRDTRFWDQARQDGLKAYFQLGRNYTPDTTETDAMAAVDSKQKYISETGTVPHAGSSEAAQLLGFKLRFYAPGAEGDSSEGTPRNLIYLAALLIKIGFISLHDLYPHLWRPDDEMDELKQIKQKEKQEREMAARPGAGASNALAKAGALSDDTAPAVPSRLREQGTRASTPGKDSEPEKTTPKDPVVEKPDQKVLLLQSLLAIGALPEALFILGRFPWMMDLIPELPEYVNRVLHHSLSHLYAQIRPLNARDSARDQQPLYEADAPGLPKGQARLEQAPQRRTLRWPLLDRNDTELDGVNYRFYWDEWNDNVPMCRSVDDVFTLTQTLLPLVGAKIGQDVALILKFARIGKYSLRQDSSSENRNRWLDLIKRLLLPAVSMTKSNPGVVNEVFELCSMYSLETRYRMYMEWHKGDTSRTPDMRSVFDLASAETRDVLKKISKTNIKPMARALAGIAYANPHIVINAALPQIESYDSIADVFVQGSKYFTDLGYDVLTWALVVSMEKDNRVGIQADGLFASKWLTALSSFIGKVYARFPLMKPGPILQYVAKQLNKGTSVELIILEQLIVAMGGISPDADYNDAQLVAMGGGPLLQSQTLLQLLDMRHDRVHESKRLMRALQDGALVSSLLFAMAQRRQACIFQEGDAPLKAIGHQFDEITRVLGQYLDLLRSNMSIEEFKKHIPPPTRMLNEWELPVEIAFWIGRPVIQRQISDYDKEEKDIALVTDLNGDVDMKEEEASEEDGETVDDEPVTSVATPTENEITGDVDESMAEVDEVAEQRWHPVLKDIMDEISPRLPEEVIELVGPGFFVTFWQLSLYDINVPGKSYEDEMNRNKKKMASITSDRSNVSSSSAKAREREISVLKKANDDLLSENKQHLRAYSENRSRLTKEKDQWFAAKSRVSKELNTALMEYCFLPRMFLSPVDAYFCFKFVKLLHSLGAANFRTLGFYDNLFKAERLASLFFMCTSKEADHLGKFLCEVLKDLSRWHKTKATYEREAYGSKKNLPGFALRVENGKPQTMLDFNKFRDILFKWQSGLYAALIKCLSSPDYMHIRNAISILRTISPAFPAIDYHGRSLQKSVDKLRESDREDLKIASQALLGTLTRRQKEWVHPEVFRKGAGAVIEKPTATPEPTKQELKPKPEAADIKMRDVPAARKEDAASAKGDKTPSSQSRDSGRSPSRTGTPLPARPAREAPSNSLRPPRPDSRAHDLPRRVSPPPRFNSSGTLPSRPEPDSRNGYRDGRAARPPPSEAPRPDSRSGYPPRHAAERVYETHDASHRYPRPSDRPSMLDRDERPPRREHETRPEPRSEPRAGHDERRYNERETRSEREPRSDRELRPEREPRHERDHTRVEREHARPDREHSRSDRPERDYGRSDHPERRREEGPPRREPPVTSRNATPSAPAQSAPAPVPDINPARAALIHGGDDRTGVSIRGQAQDRARPPRPTSPRREDDRKHTPRIDRDERSDRRPGQIRNAPMPAPAARNPPPSAPPVREPRGRPAVDLTHGRLEQDNTNRPSSRTERAPDAEPPSGPRTRPTNVNPRNAENVPPSRPNQPRQPPSGPGRHSRTNSYAEPPAISPASPDTEGIHPSRLNNVAPPQPNQRPPPLQTSTTAAPRGAPTGPASATTQSPNTRGPPSGPQADAPAGRGQRHPMAAVNSTLAQAANGPRGPAGRGRGGMRQNSISYNQGGMPPSPVGVPQGQGFNGQQQDLINNNPNGMPVQPRGPSNRQDGQDHGRPTRSQHHDDRRDGPGYKQDDRPQRGPPPQQDRQDGPPPRSGPRGYPRGPNPNGPGDDGPNNRKHPRDEGNNAPYGGGRGGRMASDAKRPRRGG